RRFPLADADEEEPPRPVPAPECPRAASEEAARGFRRRSADRTGPLETNHWRPAWTTLDSMPQRLAHRRGAFPAHRHARWRAPESRATASLVPILQGPTLRPE